MQLGKLLGALCLRAFVMKRIVDRGDTQDWLHASADVVRRIGERLEFCRHADAAERKGGADWLAEE